MSRPPKPIDWELVDRLLEAGCLGTEIAANFDMHPSTFYERVTEQYKMSFTQYSSEKKSKGDSILRAVQYQVAVKDKDKTMLIWLGKQRIGQKEPETEPKPAQNQCVFNSEYNNLKKQAESECKLVQNSDKP
jgi:hypothetical protein